MKQQTKNQFTSNQHNHPKQSRLKCFYSDAYRYMQLPTYRLVSSQEYQRKVDPRHVDEIIANFNPLYLGEIIVSFRDGQYFVVDGQNRIAAQIKKNDDHQCLVNCKVYSGLTYEDEAAMFYHLDAISNKMKYNERVKAMSEAKDNPSVQDIKKILQAAGLKWSLSGNKNGARYTISASQALIDSYETYGGVILGHALSLLAHTWHGDVRTLTAPFIKGISLFSRTYAQMITEEQFVRKLSKTMPGEIKMLALQETMISRQDVKYAKAFLKKYNINRQQDNRLPDLLENTSMQMQRRRRTA